jgi:hypothetical protein
LDEDRVVYGKMSAFIGSTSVFLVALAPLLGCAEEVSARPARQPQQVVVLEPVETVNSAPVVTQPVGQVVAPAPVTLPAAGDRAPAARDIGALETWASRNPEAAKAFGAWVHDNPEAAGEIFSWDGHHPDRSRGLVYWAIRHPSQDISAFTSQHPDWSWFDRVMGEHKLGASQYLAWCRKYPSAAEELVAQPSGLRWVGDHVYPSEWRP